MLRLTFGPDDLGRVRFAVSAVAQSVRSACTGQCPRRDSELRKWQKRVYPRASGVIAPLLDLVNVEEGYYSDLLTPGVSAAAGLRRSFDEEMDALLDAPGEMVVADLTSLSHESNVLRLADRLNAPDGGGRKKLVDALGDYHRVLVAQDWPRIRSHLEADIARRAMLAATFGVNHMLATLHERISWNPPVLTLAGCRPKEFELRGRGLLLVPAVFAPHSVAWVLNDWQQPTLIYPAGNLTGFWDPSESVAGTAPALDCLIGRGRAAALRAIGAGCGTGELANQLGVSLATASEHAAALRRGGLISSERTGRRVEHMLTQFGLDLLTVR